VTSSHPDHCAQANDPVFGVDGGDLVRNIATRLHAAVRRSRGNTSGQCKNASVALALALVPLGEPVAICYGVVVVEGTEHPHAWCRVAHIIIDATADQFGGDGPLIAPEVELPQYQEEGFLLFNPMMVREFLRVGGFRT
jgi:hypothetical protein